MRHGRGSDRAGQRSRSATAGSRHVASDEFVGQGRRRSLQPGPHRLHDHRAAGLRLDLHLEWFGSRPRRQGDSGLGQVHHRVAHQEDRRGIPVGRRPDRRGRGADHHPVRRADQRQGRRREGAHRHHQPARRGQLGVAARRGARRPRALAARASTTRRAPPSTSTPSSTGCRSATAPTAPHDISLNIQIGRRQVVRAEVYVAPDPGGQRRGRHHGLPVQLRRGRQGAQRHPQRHPRGQREIRGLLHVQPGRRLQQCPRTLGGADLEQRRVHPCQPGKLGCTGQHQRHQRLHQPVDGQTPSSTSPARSTVTRSR